MPGLLSSHHSFLTWIFSSQCGYFPYPSLHSHLHCPLPPPLTQDQTSPQNPQTWLKGNTSSAWSLSPPSLLPCHISIANTIFFKWTSPLSHWYTTSQYHEHCVDSSSGITRMLSLNLHHVQHSGPAQPIPLTMKEDDMILILSSNSSPLTQVQKKSPVSGSLSMATPPVKLFSTNSSLTPLSHNC